MSIGLTHLLDIDSVQPVVTEVVRVPERADRQPRSSVDEDLAGPIRMPQASELFEIGAWRLRLGTQSYVMRTLQGRSRRSKRVSKRQSTPWPLDLIPHAARRPAGGPTSGGHFRRDRLTAEARGQGKQGTGSAAPWPNRSQCSAPRLWGLTSFEPWSPLRAWRSASSAWA